MLTTQMRPLRIGTGAFVFHFKNPLIICSSASCSVSPSVISLIICSPAIGKIAGDQLLKLQTLGLTEEEAEDRILKGFLA